MIDGAGANPFQIGHLQWLSGVVQPPHCGNAATITGRADRLSSQDPKYWEIKDLLLLRHSADPDP
jgi:hypothetical protein